MLEITEPAYPLPKAAFTRALMMGHGRALIHAELRKAAYEDTREIAAKYLAVERRF